MYLYKDNERQKKSSLGGVAHPVKPGNIKPFFFFFFLFFSSFFLRGTKPQPNKKKLGKKKSGNIKSECVPSR